MTAMTHPRIVIVGGGTGGISVAARLRRKLKQADITVIEPSDKHYYQPIWTLVGAGVFPKAVSERPEASVIPKGVQWLRDAVASFDPDRNELTTVGGRHVGYDFLVVAAGIQLNWDKIPGLRETLGRNGVGSNYSFGTVGDTWKAIREFRGGTALFTMPNTPVKCGGAPQKIMYLAEDYFRRTGVRDQAKIIFASGAGNLFAVPKYRATLEKVVARKNIETRFKTNLVEVRGDAREAVLESAETGERQIVRFDMLHATPPMSAPDFIRRSPLANPDGWVETDRSSLRHPRFANIFALGDAAGLPTSKTGAAIRAQAPVLVENLACAVQGKSLSATYKGYTSCPLVTGYGSLVLAEFDYELNPQETFPFDQSKERHSMYLLKKYLLPAMYWNGMLKGYL